MEWLLNLNKGDKVIEVNHPWETILTVSRTTKTQIIIEDENMMGNKVFYKFRKDTGRAVGAEGFHSTYITEATEERVTKLRAKIKRNDLVNKVTVLMQKRLSKLTNSQMESIINIFEQP